LSSLSLFGTLERVESELSHSFLEFGEISKRRSASLSRGGALLERGTYVLRGGDLSHLPYLICGAFLKLQERCQPYFYTWLIFPSQVVCPPSLGSAPPLFGFFTRFAI
jgi:hypothetical protein